MTIEELVSGIRSSLAGGKTYRQTAEALGITATTVKDLARVLGIVVPKREKKTGKLKPRALEVVEAYKAGEQISEIVRRVHVTRATVYNWLKRGGVKFEPKPVHQYYNRETILPLYDRYCRGETIEQIAASCGMSGGNLRRLFKQERFEMRTPGKRPRRDLLKPTF